jgi:SSU ribosomal protein S4P
MKLFLKGDRCFTNKCAIERRNFPPGQHGKRRSKILGYGIQLREKQKLKRFYGLLETQFRLTFEKAERMRGVTGENLLSLLERRSTTSCTGSGSPPPGSRPASSSGTATSR